ncbi:MAG: phosphatase PAP2 family protein [Phycisphaeraceae bacterium]|nr:phosphatase PAP2 family protein [Phycisphaeraceae bacterium]
MRMGLAAVALIAAVGSAKADIVTDWNNVWIETIRATGGGPCPITRNGALLHVAIYDAVNSIRRTHEPFFGFIDVNGNANIRAAVSAAAHRILVEQYPSRASIYDAYLADVLASIPNTPAKNRGINVGIAAAEQALAARSSDGTDDNTPYEFGTQPGDYIIADPQLFTQPHGPNWWKSDPWTIPDVASFQPAKPLGFANKARLLRSLGYARQVNEVKRLGERNSPFRTADQTEIAWFWANDRDGTFKPPGHINYSVQVVSEQLGLSVPEKARLFALINVALADAVLVTWSAKYKTNIDLWRPVTAIQFADLDNNPRTEPDPTWQPLLEFSPPFPAYTSGHSSMGGVWAGVMQNFVGTDEFTYTLGTDEPIVSNVTRTFTSFSQAGKENAISRVFLGVHFRMDCEQAYATGVMVADYIFNNAMRPKCPADMNGDGVVNSIDMYIFAADYFQGKESADYNKDGVISSADMTMFVRDYNRGCVK